jgi:hypothetical protein
MPKKRIFLGTIIILLVLVICSNVFVFSASAATASTQLKIYVGPTSLPADNRAYSSIAVQLLDSKGKPLRATEDIQIHLSSSLTNVGTVDPSITISKGSTMAQASFRSTYTPGKTTITAAASGYMTVQAPITTVGPLPSTLAVYGFPPTLPADGGSYPAIIVQLQDAAGAPAKAPVGDVQVTLSSSNATISAVDASVIIRGGSTYAVATVTTSSSTGSAVITAIASGYSSKQATLTTQVPMGDPVNLKVYVAPPKVPADGVVYQQVAVQLQNASGKIAKAPANIAVSLSSSSSAVGTVETQITVPTGKVYGLAQFTSTFRSGTTSINAAATNCKSSQEAITTVGPIPSKLAVYNLPSVLPADGESYDAVQVQLQDAAGKPAKDPVGNITVYLFSSTPDAGNVSSVLTIPFGDTHAAGTFYATYAANSTTITAQSSGYDPGQAKITTYLIDQFALNISATATPDVLSPGEKATIRAYVAYNGSSPASSSTVLIKSDKNGNCTATKDEGTGYYSSVFTAPNVSQKTVYTIAINASKTGYNSTVLKLPVTVSPNATDLAKRTLTLHVAEDNGSPLSGVSVNSQTMPAGANSLNGVTNATGDVTFFNLLAGTYIVQISGAGYDMKEQIIQFVPGQTAHTATLTKSSFFSLPVIIAIAVAAVVTAVVVFLVIRRRRNA